MSTVARHVSRSNSSSHHHRQHSDNFLIDTTSLHSNKWLHSSQDYGTGGPRSRSSRSLMSSNPVYSRSSSLRRNGEDQMQSAADFSSSGLLDLHSFDSELLPEKASNMWDGYLLHQPDLVRNPYNSESNVLSDKLINRYQASSENSLLQSFSADKERSNPVAKIKVVVRKRPLNKKEIAKKEKDIITIERNCNSLAVHETKLKVDLTEYVEKHEFVFDAVLDEGVSNDEVYSQTVEPIVPLIFQRTKATCFAYGQTGSGKTYTMQPLPLKASQDILKLMLNTYRNQGFQLFVSFFEIYGGKLFDLLNDRRKLCMREDGKQQVCIVGLQEYKVSNVEIIKELIDLGNSTRSTGTTGANEESSRSHAILQLAIKRLADNMESKPARLVGKLSFIDLAGSERGADTTDNDKQTRIEGAEINKSLLALKECIRALDNDQNHIPFRGSKLTEVLRDSFVGDSRTVMISCISPSSGSCEHTLNTLRYADRVKSLSKGASSKKDLTSSSISTRDSTTLPVLPVSTTDSSTNNAFNENNRFGWSKDIDQEASPPARGDYSFSNPKDVRVHDRDHYEEPNVHEKSSWMYTDKEEPDLRAFEERNEVDNQREVNRRLDFGGTDGDDDLNVLLKEEEDLLTAHRRQVEETMEIVREEMSLLAEADQPGNQLDDYVSKLSYILSQKAAGILQLQTRLAQFHRRLTEYNVLVSSGN